jgi:hypothetical protein
VTEPITIRAAELTDAESGGACHLACWREAYAGIVDPERLAVLTATVAERVDLWRRWITEGYPLVVAVDSEEVVGFSIAGPATEPDLDIGFQLHAINVRRAYWVPALPSGSMIDPSAIAPRFSGFSATIHALVPSMRATAIGQTGRRSWMRISAPW